MLLWAILELGSKAMNGGYNIGSYLLNSDVTNEAGLVLTVAFIAMIVIAFLKEGTTWLMLENRVNKMKTGSKAE